MKKTISFLYGLLLLVKVNACDLCGCNPGVFSGDFLSSEPQSYAALSSSYKQYKMLDSSSAVERIHLFNQTLTIGYSPKSWVELRLMLPYSLMVNQYAADKKQSVGLNDITLFGNFRIINKLACNTKHQFGHQLNIGAGVEFPAGQNIANTMDELQNFTFGSRSFDVPMSLTYLLSYKNWSLIQFVYMKFNTVNKEKVRYGSMYTYQLSASYQHNFKKIAFLPNTGLRFEFQDRNLRKNIIQHFSGTKLLLLTAGFDIKWKMLSGGLSLQQPLWQNTANFTIKQKNTITLNLRYQFPKIKKKTNSSPIN